MFAVIKTGGKQYIVSEGDKIKIEKLEKKENEEVKFEDVLLFVDDKGSVDIGSPLLKDVSVKGSVIEQGRGDKKIIFKHKPKKRYKVKRGHRQPYTEVEIKEIKKGKAESKTKIEKKEEPKKEAKKATNNVKKETGKKGEKK